IPRGQDLEEEVDRVDDQPERRVDRLEVGEHPVGEPERGRGALAQLLTDESFEAQPSFPGLGDLEPADEDALVVLVGEVDDLDPVRVPTEIGERLAHVLGALVRRVEQDRNGTHARMGELLGQHRRARARRPLEQGEPAHRQGGREGLIDLRDPQDRRFVHHVQGPSRATSIVSSTTRFRSCSTLAACSSVVWSTSVRTWRLFRLLRRMWRNSERSSGGLWTASELTLSMMTVDRGLLDRRRRYSTRSMIDSSARGLSTYVAFGRGSAKRIIRWLIASTNE